MGPALRLTPLSPACGSCRSRKLYARRFNAAPKSSLSSPGARAGAGSVGGWVWSRGPPLSPGGSETVLSTRASSGSTLPEGFAEPRHGPEVRPVRLCALAASSSPGIRIAPGQVLSLTSSRSSAARHSPSRRSGSKIPSSAPAFRPLSRRGQSPSRCLEDALPERFGQLRTGRLIHFRQFCQWTRLDNSTVRRKMGGLSPLALRQQP